MINLAGREDADAYIYTELLNAGIDIVDHGGDNQWSSKGEVQAYLTGKLGDITFRRAWYYWVVECRIPLEYAELIYTRSQRDKLAIRVDGHCMDPPPKDWAQPIIPYEEVGELINLARAGQIAYDQIDEILNERYKNVPKYITLYHIDTQEGLGVFASMVRLYGLDKNE